MSVKAHNRVAPREADAIVYTPTWKVYHYTHADLNASNVIAFPIEKGTHILGVAHRTLVAFDNAADLTVGDSTDADGFLTAALLTPTTVNDFVFSQGAGAAFSLGKLYTANDRLILTFSADPAAGEGEVRVLMSGIEEF